MIHRLASIFLICCTALLVWGCEEGVDPFVGEEKPFTLWGYMDSGSDTQMVRVFSINEQLGLDRSGPIDAEVFSTDLTTGEQRQWRDSVIVFEGIGAGHVFWSDFTAQHEHRYRLEVRRSDGATSSVEVTAPPPSSLQVDRNTTSTLIQVNVIGNIPNIVGAEVVYRVFPAYPALPWPEGLIAPPPVLVSLSIPYTDKIQPVSGGRAFKIDMIDDYATAREELKRNCIPWNMIMRDMEVRLLVADSSWSPPGGVFDPEVLIEPNAFSNVENGFGFFGAGQTLSQSWLPGFEPRIYSGYTFQSPCLNVSTPACLISTWPCFRCEEALTPSIRELYCGPEPLLPPSPGISLRAAH